MSNNHVPTAFGVLVVLGMLAGPVNAAEDAVFGAKLLVCNACHGQDGTPRNAAIPVIWGQQESFLVKQLHDFQSGGRASEVMSWMAKTLTAEDTDRAAAIFAKKDWPARSARVAAASAPAEMALCQICHAQNLAGGPTAGGATAPRLAGQNYEYLVEAMRHFADGERANNAEMTAIMAAIPSAERETIARYISGL
jgi:cytochrome c553